MSLSNSVIIAGGGTGTRMNAKIPKQFLLLKDEPVIIHIIKRFFNYENKIEIIVVLPAAQIEFWENMRRDFKFNIPHTVVVGGDTRFHSVKNGLDAIKTNGLTAVHDAVRPLVSNKLISNCFETAAKKHSVVPVIELSESLRIISGNDSSGCNRELYRLVQTPQVFKTSILKKAYQQPYSEYFTDDASVVESIGEKISLVKGDKENIKITSPLDLVVAEVIMRNIRE
jgi:2-C-methyl-D-erythritol 4-phosphate cytidylyltransferase